MTKSVKVGLVLALLAGMSSFAGGTASATSGQVSWGGQGWPNASCTTNPQNMLWIFTGKGDISNVVFHWDSTSLPMTQQGGGSWHVTTPFFDPTLPANQPIFVSFDGTLSSTNAQVVLSGCNESGPTTASLTITKTIPAVLEGTESVTISFVLTVHGGDPATPADVVGTCDLTFTAISGTSQNCTFVNLQPTTQYDLWETDSGGFTPMDPNPLVLTTGAAGSNTFGGEIVNTFGPATAQACKVTDVDNTGHDASADSFTFTLYEDGTAVGTPVTVTGGGTANAPHCSSFSYELKDNHVYTIVETSSPTGYTQDSLVCSATTRTGTITSFTPQYPDDADAVFTCTATDSITAAHATVRKVTIPAGHEAGWTFDLKANGVTVETVTTTDATAVNFTTDLQDGVTYTVVEHQQAEWDSNGGVGCTFTVHYPADSGATFNCVFTNTHVSAGLTMGYWKNHLAVNGTTGCTGLPQGTGCSKNGPFTKTYLPKTLGSYTVTNIQQAAAVFAAANCSSTTSQGAVACLAGQLLAAELNVANGASHCADAVIADANTFLSGGTVDGVTGVTYTGPSGTYSLTLAQRAEAIKLKTALDTYNNGTCP